jgi:hypothetical protein
VKSLKRLAATTATSIAVTLSLAGCWFVYVDNPNGRGSCGGDPVTLSVSQDTVGRDISIDYTGPADVSLFYMGASLFVDFERELVDNESGLAISTGSNSVGLFEFDTTSGGWTRSAAPGGLVNWSFDGDTLELVNPDEFETMVEGDGLRSIPATIAVSCDETITTGDYDDTNPSTSAILDGVDIEVAQPLFARNSTIEPPRIIAQNVVDGDIVIDFEFAPGTSNRFADFSLGGGYAGVSSIRANRNGEPVVSPASLEGSWWNLFDGCPAVVTEGTLCNASPDNPHSWTFEGTNRWVISDGDRLVNGEYLATFLLFDDVENGDDLRIAFTRFTFDSENGVDIVPLDARGEELAPTGGDPNVLIWAVFGGLVVLAAVALRPRRREVQADSTIDPSARNE